MDVKESADSDCQKCCCQEFAAKVNYGAVTSHIVSESYFTLIKTQNTKTLETRNHHVLKLDEKFPVCPMKFTPPSDWLTNLPVDQEVQRVGSSLVLWSAGVKLKRVTVLFCFQEAGGV